MCSMCLAALLPAVLLAARASAATTAAASGSPAGVGSGVAAAQYDTIVVGLGAAGAAAAGTLAAAGRRVLALEAQDRVGGRVHTAPLGDCIVELGAEWIHGTEGSVTYELARAHNVSVVAQVVARRVYRSDGSRAREELVNELSDVAMHAYTHPPPEPASLGEHMERQIREYLKEKHPDVATDEDFVSNFLDFMDQLVGSYESCDSWRDVTTASASQPLAGTQTMSWHTLGYRTLFQILLNTYNNGPGYPTLDIKLNSEVTRIQWAQQPQDHVVVTVKDGTTYTARSVIVTLSLGVLKERHRELFSPALPASKVAAIESVSMGVCCKMFLLFEEVWWEAGTFGAWVWRGAERAGVGAGEDAWLLRVNLAGSPLSCPRALSLWACGAAAREVESLPEEEVSRKVMGLVRRFMGAGRTLPDPTHIIKSSWYSNPFTRGSYSFDNTQSWQHPGARRELARPLPHPAGTPRLLFAGEATEPTHFSNVHGAVESGQREARRLLSTA